MGRISRPEKTKNNTTKCIRVLKCSAIFPSLLDIWVMFW
jgi:hypothetical protein